MTNAINDMTTEQLAEAVAIEVMGFTDTDPHGDFQDGYYWYDKNGESHYMKQAIAPGDIVWSPSTLIAQAMECFDRVNTPMVIHKLKWKDGSFSYYITTSPYEQMIRVLSFSFQDLPRKICEACLTAVRAK